jgi:hypothetical protein
MPAGARFEATKSGVRDESVVSGDKFFGPDLKGSVDLERGDIGNLRKPEELERALPLVVFE